MTSMNTYQDITTIVLTGRYGPEKKNLKMTQTVPFVTIL